MGSSGWLGGVVAVSEASILTMIIAQGTPQRLQIVYDAYWVGSANENRRATPRRLVQDSVLADQENLRMIFSDLVTSLESRSEGLRDNGGLRPESN